MALSLPTIKRRQVGRLSTTDPSLAVQKTKSSQAMLHTVAGLGESYLKREAQNELRDATLSVHKADADFIASNKGIEEYNLDETEDEDLINVANSMGITEGTVPSYKVYAKLRQKKYAKSVQDASGTMDFAGNRKDFTSAQAMKEAGNFAEDSSRATKEQIQYIARTTMASVEESLLTRDFGGARLEIALSGMSSERKMNAIKDVDMREQNDYFSEAIENRSIPAMQTALDQLIKNDPRTTSELNADKQKVLANQLRTAIGTEKNAITAGVNSQLKLYSEDLKTQIKDTWGNKKVDLGAMEKHMKALAEKDPVLVREAKWTLDNQPIVSAILRETPEEQAAIYKHAVETSEGNMEKSYLVEQLGSAIDEGNRMRQTDAMTWANDTGFIVMEPMDYSSPDAMTASLSNRLKQVVSIQDNYHAFTGFFSESELADFGNLVENASTKEQLGIFGGISQSLGENAPALYEQLKKNNISGTAALAGQLIARGPGYRVAAENILRGAELRKEDTITQLAVKEADLDPTILQKFGTMFAGNKKHQSIMAEAFKDVWAVTRNSDIAFEQLTGGAIEYHGSTIQPPAPGVGAFKYGRHLKDIEPLWWAGDGMKAHGYSPTQLRDGVLDGSLIQIGVGENVNNLMKPNGDIVTRPDGVTPLPFSIDMSEPTTSARHRGIKEDYDKKLKEDTTKARAKKAASFQKAWSEVGSVKGGPT